MKNLAQTSQADNQSYGVVSTLFTDVIHKKVGRFKCELEN